MLTKKQRNLLIFINKKIRSTGISPSYDEMKNSLNLKSKSGIHRLISALEERGFIKRLPHKARALEVLKLPETASANDIYNTFSPSVIRGGLDDTNSKSNNKEISVLGSIAAGTPIEAISHEGENVALPQGMIGHGEHYALTIEGDSMINAGINNADTVIIKRCDTAENGAIIVALVDGEEATLKTLRRAGGKIVLEPENEAYEPRVLEPERVKIQGRLVSLIRTYH